MENALPPSFIWICLGENSYQNFLSIQRALKWAFSLFTKAILCVIQTFWTATKNDNKNVSSWNLLPGFINNNKSQYYDSVLQLPKKGLFLFLRIPKLCVCCQGIFKDFCPSHPWSPQCWSGTPGYKQQLQSNCVNN